LKLQILIPTLPDDKSRGYLRRLNSILDPQIAKFAGQVDKIIDDRGKHIPTGTKRNDMISYCDADYFSQVDCDDIISHNYVEKMLRGISDDPDVVTLNGWMTTNGKSRVDFIIRLGEKYEERDGKYYRFPNHLCAFKREKVESIKFPPIWQGEDYQWAKRINDKKILKSEYHIEDLIYHYEFLTSK
jgi:glycosyltransferase involved in cell wall biosynthesis